MVTDFLWWRRADRTFDLTDANRTLSRMVRFLVQTIDKKTNHSTVYTCTFYISRHILTESVADVFIMDIQSRNVNFIMRKISFGA